MDDIPNIADIPNRYGGLEDTRFCRHSIELWRTCERCNQLLDKREEKPTLIGTGPVVKDMSEFKG